MGGSGDSLGTLFKKQFTPGKITFHILFWGMHWGFFAFGWYVPEARAFCPRAGG